MVTLFILPNLSCNSLLLKPAVSLAPLNFRSSFLFPLHKSPILLACYLGKTQDMFPSPPQKSSQFQEILQIKALTSFCITICEDRMAAEYQKSISATVIRTLVCPCGSTPRLSPDFLNNTTICLLKKPCSRMGVVVDSFKPSRGRQISCEFQASLVYIDTLSQKKQPTNQMNEQRNKKVLFEHKSKL